MKKLQKNIPGRTVGLEQEPSAANVFDLKVISVRIMVGSLKGNPHHLVLHIISSSPKNHQIFRENTRPTYFSNGKT